MDWSKKFYTIQLLPSGTFDSIEKNKQAPLGTVFAVQTQDDWNNVLVEHAKLSKGLRKSIHKSVTQIRSENVHNIDKIPEHCSIL